MGFEPTTFSLARRHSTTESRPHSGGLAIARLLALASNLRAQADELEAVARSLQETNIYAAKHGEKGWNGKPGSHSRASSSRLSSGDRNTASSNAHDGEGEKSSGDYPAEDAWYGLASAAF